MRVARSPVIPKIPSTSAGRGPTGPACPCAICSPPGSRRADATGSAPGGARWDQVLVCRAPLPSRVITAVAQGGAQRGGDPARSRPGLAHQPGRDRGGRKHDRQPARDVEDEVVARHDDRRRHQQRVGDPQGLAPDPRRELDQRPRDHRRHPHVQARHRRHRVVEGADELRVELEEGLAADRVGEPGLQQARRGDRLERVPDHAGGPREDRHVAEEGVGAARVAVDQEQRQRQDHHLADHVEGVPEGHPEIVVHEEPLQVRLDVDPERLLEVDQGCGGAPALLQRAAPEALHEAVEPVGGERDERLAPAAPHRGGGPPGAVPDRGQAGAVGARRRDPGPPEPARSNPRCSSRHPTTPQKGPAMPDRNIGHADQTHPEREFCSPLS